MKVKFTELNSGYEGERHVSRFSEKSKSKAIIAGVLILTFVFVYILSAVGVIPLGALSTRMKSSISGDSENFPLSINTESTLYTDVLGDNIIIVTTENVSVYGQNGRLIYSQPHSFAKPGFSVNGEKSIVFDRGGNGFMLLNEKKFVYEGTADNTIISAQYGKDGNYALGVRSDTATSVLTVYGKDHKIDFQWKCSDEYIVSIALSDNGKYAGVAVMGAENGELFTTVQYFGFDYKEPLNTQKIDGVSAFDLDFTSYNMLTLITDKGIYGIDRKSEKYTQINTYYSTEFNSCHISEKGNYVVALAKYGSENVFEVTVYEPKGDVKATISADYEIAGVYISDKYVFALAEDKILVYNLRGKQVSEITYRGDVNGLLPTDDYIFILSLDKISRCFTFGNSEIELT